MTRRTSGVHTATNLSASRNDYAREEASVFLLMTILTTIS